jgi:PAS domain S-box-containing protein
VKRGREATVIGGRFLDRFIYLAPQDKKSYRFAIAVGFFLVIAPLIAAAALTYWSTRRDFTTFTLSQRQAVAYFAATTLKEKLDRMVDITVSLASRVRFRQMVREGHWDEASKILRDVPNDFPFIDQLYIIDLLGNLMSETPSLPESQGKSFAGREWYGEVTRNWKPYVSRVYQRSTGPKSVVVAIATPVKSSEGKPVGILVANVKLSFLLGWSDDIEVGKQGVVQVVDQGGRVAANPDITTKGEIQDYSKVPVVQRVLQGQRGVEVIFDPIKKARQAIAYEPVPTYRWGVIVEQPEANAFALRNASLNKLLFAYLIATIVTGCIAYLLWRFIAQRRRAGERFRALVDSAPDAMIIAQRSGTISLVNTQAEKLFGYKREEMVGRPVEMLLPESYRERHVAHRENYFKDPRRRPMNIALELHARRKNGSEFPVEISLSPLETDQGMMVTTSIRDITERKQAEVRIRQARAFSESVVDTVMQPLLVLDSDFRVKSANRSFYRAFKTTPQETENKVLYELANGMWNEPRLCALLERIFTHDTRLMDFDVDRDIPGIGRRILRLNASRLRRDIGEGAMALLAIEDITTQARYEEELRRKSEELATQNRLVHEANRLKSEFLANMSHELRTPLNAIIGFAQLMHDGKVGPVSIDHKEYLGDILASGRHLLHLINDTLDLAKIEAGRLDLRPEPVSLTKIVAEVKQILLMLTTQKHLDVESEISPALERVFLDPAKLKQVLYNYLSNAAKFTPHGGRIVIRGVPDGADCFRLEVEDNGAGIKADEIHKLFVEFQQLDGGTTKRHQGTGLGLALTKKLVEVQGGQVGVQSIYGRGSLFYAVLPRIDKGEPRSDRAAKSNVRTASSGQADQAPQFGLEVK